MDAQPAQMRNRLQAAHQHRQRLVVHEQRIAAAQNNLVNAPIAADVGQRRRDLLAPDGALIWELAPKTIAAVDRAAPAQQQ